MFMTAIVILLAAFVSAAASDNPPASTIQQRPKIVKALIDRIVDCNHWSGEEAYNADRAKEIEKAIDDLHCDRLEADEATVLKKYGNSAKVKKAVSDAHDLYQ